MSGHYDAHVVTGLEARTAKGNPSSKSIEVHPHMVDLLADASLDALADPEFRVLSLMGERKGIRLEAVFWQALDQIATEMHVPRNTLVLWIMVAAGHDRHNVTSVLRSVAVAYLLGNAQRHAAPPS